MVKAAKEALAAWDTLDLGVVALLDTGSVDTDEIHAAQERLRLALTALG
jgi:hypothetical protein